MSVTSRVEIYTIEFDVIVLLKLSDNRTPNGFKFILGAIKLTKSNMWKSIVTQKISIAMI